ncbi:Hypothetical protein FKW44_018424 [Caligus rogercresseyi]|uniref:Uncharacterized protein n=1 Tax=Caligus rogercresseyi TaxID=217165 RepID=A0A7T8GUX8_CALRO|nr:Hypothetical protein FKW44_018424 [Caligus rogercresseyi]
MDHHRAHSEQGPQQHQKSKKINKGCSFESVVFSGSPDEEGLEPIFGFFNRRLSALRHKRPLYLRLLSSFLREVREWETTSQGVREALPSRSYEILERENEDGLLTFEFHLRGGEEEPFFALFWSMDITP